MAVKKSELYSILWEACNKLRGGVEPSRYKDYVLILLFFKYVSDKYNGQEYGDFEVTEDVSFNQLVNLKGKTNIGEEVDKIIQAFLEKNELVGLLPDVSFNNQAELGEGKELVDKLSGLIAIFENPALNFKSNRASGDDIIGDAYEFFMMKFAQESGKSKGQFYTPSEVSRVVAKLIGIDKIKKKAGKVWELYDPACGSGSLLIKAADEAPKNKEGNSIVSIFGQEKYQDTAGLAKMNFILHNKSTGEVVSGNTLSNPKYLTTHGDLKKFDFAVMNPPFSDKDWTDGLNEKADKFNRFSEYGIPPQKNGDYAWFLHVLKSLNENGKAGIILPHGVLFRGNAEEDIRKKIIEKKYIKGIIGLPANLFYGTGIPASIILVDKEKDEERDGIFFIDASKGFKKDGNKNRLREQDIEKIVQTYINQLEISGYSRLVSYEEISDKNSYNLNIARYVQTIEDTLPQSIKHHLQGGIPKGDIDSLEKLWSISSELKNKIFENKNGTYYLREYSDSLEEVIANDTFVVKEKEKENVLFKEWTNQAELLLNSIGKKTQPKNLIRDISLKILNKYESARILDNYSTYDYLLNYWNDVMQDDVYIIKSSGYEAAREIEIEYKVSKGKVTKTINHYDGLLIPVHIIENEYFEQELLSIQKLQEQVMMLISELEILVEENSGEDGLLDNVLNSKGDGILKTNLTNRIKELSKMKESKSTKYKEYRKEHHLLLDYQNKLNEKDKIAKKLKKERQLLDESIRTKYKELTTDEIKYLLIHKKWFTFIENQIVEATEQALNDLASEVVLIAKRYKDTLQELEKNVDESRAKVKFALKRMGYTW